jgi:hypothetical protein
MVVFLFPAGCDLADRTLLCFAFFAATALAPYDDVCVLWFRLKKTHVQF